MVSTSLPLGDTLQDSWWMPETTDSIKLYNFFPIYPDLYTYIPMSVMTHTYIPMSVCMLSCFSRVWLCATNMDYVACHTSLSKGFSRQEYWSGFPCPPRGGSSLPRDEPTSFVSPSLTGEFFTTSTTWEAPCIPMIKFNLQIRHNKRLTTTIIK